MSGKRLDDFRLVLAGREFVPIVQGGMGMDISTRNLAVAVAALGGIGHISDAMVPALVDRDFGTRYSIERTQTHRENIGKIDKSSVQWDLGDLRAAQTQHVEAAMAEKKGDGAIFINCMEKQTMNNGAETLRVRLNAALDAGIDGITLSAGLHMGTFGLIADNARFRDAALGIIVSSKRALNLFLKRAARLERMPDYIIVEGPLAGGHLGFGEDWRDYDLATITQEVIDFLAEKQLDIPVIPAGGVFTGSDGVDFLERGAAAVQVATRFTITKEAGLPYDVKQKYLAANEEDVEVNSTSPTGYLMRMLKNSPAIGANVRPGCETYGYLLTDQGTCGYVDAYEAASQAAGGGVPETVPDKTCLCTMMRNFKVYTCGHNVYRLKDTTTLLPDGSYNLLDAEHVFRDYQFSSDHEIDVPADPIAAEETAGALVGLS